jgi:hypothetical protein
MDVSEHLGPTPFILERLRYGIKNGYSTARVSIRQNDAGSFVALAFDSGLYDERSVITLPSRVIPDKKTYAQAAQLWDNGPNIRVEAADDCLVVHLCSFKTTSC